MAALAGRLVEIAKEGPVLFLDLGNYTSGPTPSDRMESSDTVLKLYGQIAQVSGVTMVVTPGPSDPEPPKALFDCNLIVTTTDPKLPDVRQATAMAGSLPVRICAVATEGLDEPSKQNSCLKTIEKVFTGNPGQIRLALVTGGGGVTGEVMARRIWRETSADLVLWTENGLGYVDGQQGRVLAAAGDKGSLCEVEVRQSGLFADRLILDVARFGNPEIERRMLEIDQNRHSN